ncbi:hypothetical protein [Nitrosococcus watsonii]|uniref:STAS domain-containing protein n=1 Tax=Nitrosococcus watsoni (strain C-113) TaxID=105559 RepID=D8K6A3_NITWC|nr:hypothetical protein [Nitrosococcus watsonii]ADJ28430.1 conserved hypothetical protein [Nitrosococcus watsonii C-113]
MPLTMQFARNHLPLARLDNPTVALRSPPITVTLTSPPILDSSLCRELWETAQQVRGNEIKVVIDLRATVSIHHSGYLLLQMLQESVAKERAELVLLHCPAHLKKALRARGFESYFTLL